MDRTGDWQVSDPLAVAAAEPVVPSAPEFLHYLAESRLFRLPASWTPFSMPTPAWTRGTRRG